MNQDEVSILNFLENHLGKFGCFRSDIYPDRYFFGKSSLSIVMVYSQISNQLYISRKLEYLFIHIVPLYSIDFIDLIGYYVGVNLGINIGYDSIGFSEPTFDILRYVQYSLVSIDFNNLKINYPKVEKQR